MIFSYYFFSFNQLLCLSLILFQAVTLDDASIKNYLHDQKKYIEVRNKMSEFETGYIKKIVKKVESFKVMVIIKAGLYKSFDKLRGYTIYAILAAIKNYYKTSCTELESWTIAKIFLVRVLVLDTLVIFSVTVIAKLYVTKMQLENAWILYIFGIILSGVLTYLPIDSIKHNNERKRKEISQELPSFITKVILLINAGLTTNKAIEEVAKTKPSLLSEFMQLVSKESNRGISNQDKTIYHGFVLTKDMLRFLSIIEQDNVLGGNQIKQQLINFSRDIRNESVQHAKRQGQLGSSKLLLPLMITFLGIMLLIIAPVFMSIM